MKARAPIKVNLAARAANAEIRRQKTRAKLLEAGLAVLAEKGPSASIEDYAAAAGVARGTFYNYFPTTDDLMNAVRRDILRMAAGELTPHLTAVEDPAARIAVISFFLIDFSRRNPERGWAALRLDRLQPTRRAGDPDVVEATLVNGAEAGRFRPVDPWAARTLVTGALRMAIHDTLTSAPPPSHAEAIIAMILAGLGVEYAEAAAIARKAAARQAG